MQPAFCFMCGTIRRPKTKRTLPMLSILRATLILSVLGLAACDEVAVANDPVARAELRAAKSCVAAVEKETGAAGVAMNTTSTLLSSSSLRYSVGPPQ